MILKSAKKTHPMKAILWKELRENGRWALLGGVVLTLAEFYILAGLQSQLSNNGGSSITLTDTTFLMVMLFGSALVAAGLAAVQILPERSRDRWAALLHRPVSRSVIFWGKATAGLVLYAAAVLVPFAASACYVAWPGKFAGPFVPGLLLPGINALAAGVAFYFGSLLLCLHRGRWRGTRGALLLAVGAVFLLQMEWSNGLFLLMPLVTASVLSLASWHAMLGEGSAARWTGLRKAAFVAVVLLGAECVLLLVDAGLNLWPQPKNPQVFAAPELEVTSEGQVLKTRYAVGGESVNVTDLAGKPVTDERYVGNNRYENLCEFWPLFYEFHAHRHGSYFMLKNGLRGLNYVQGVRLGNAARENWFLLVRQNYFIGYDNLSRRCVGICDREGFKAPGAKPVPFEDSLNMDFYYHQGLIWCWTDHRLYAVSFPDRQLKSFFDLPDRVIETMIPLPVRESSGSVRYVALALEDGLQVLDERGQPVFARPYPHDPRRWSMVMVATNPTVDRLYLRSQRGFYGVKPRGAPDTEYLDALDLRGNVLQNVGIPVDNVRSASPLWLTIVSDCLFTTAPVALVQLYHQVVPAEPTEESFFGGQSEPEVNQAGLIGMIGLEVVLAAVAFVWARRVGFSARRTWGWTVFVLAFGPAGLLAFRLAANWPERVRCPFCGHRRNLEQDTCPHCQRSWNLPEPTGTEIFQPLPVQG